MQIYIPQLTAIFIITSSKQMNTKTVLFNAFFVVNISMIIHCVQTSVFLTCSALYCVCMSCTSSQDTCSVRVQIELLLQMSGGLVHCSLGQITVFQQIFEQNHRGLHGENYLIVLILLVRWGCGHRSLYTFSLTLSLSISLFPRSLSRCHICSFSLRTNFKGKSQRARCWLLRSWLNRDPGTTWWFGMSMNVLVCVYM